MRILQLLIILIIHLGYLKIKAAFNECQIHTQCGKCISSSPQCSWCEDVYYNTTAKIFYKKCDLVKNHKTQECKNVTNPPSTSTIDKAAKLEGETRVSPQEVTILLRPGQSTSLDVTVKTPKNFPVDLYYLMDMSKSMRDDLQQIKYLGDALTQQMARITKNFRLGFGAFVDKPLAPYTLTRPLEIDTLLKRLNQEFSAQYTFSFKNYLSLNENTKEFEKTLDNVKISFNVDGPEGSLEGLMQVIVCETEIGWRDKRKARRIVILTTDQTFHFSGDGLLGGVIRQNDGKCHLLNGNYTAWDKFDYPSLSQIRSIMIENQIVPIFATTGNYELYKKVADFFGPSSGAVAVRLKNDSSNVVQRIDEAYKKIAKIVNINTDAPDEIDVKFTAVCGENKSLKDQAFCDDVVIGKEVSFKLDIMTKSCKHKNGTFKIKTNFDDIKVNYKILCDCPCEEDKSKILVDSPVCTSRGNLSCGMCFCDKKFYSGRFCQCTAAEASDVTLCRVPGKTDGDVCSGKGHCDCGECVCDLPELNENNEMEYIFGDQCQCSNARCPRSNGGLLCGGPDRGSCDCGVCICNSDWQGPSCADECVLSTAACFDDIGVECSNSGSCKCNKCECQKGYIGDYCQECVENCPDPCQEFKECVRCRVFETSELTVSQCGVECAKWNITSHITVEKVPEDKRCIARDEDDCSFVFTYNKDNVTKEIQLVVQKDRICPAEPDILAIILGVIAGIVGIGLALLLIWKLLATIQDRREFAQFEKETKGPRWNTGENPIFQQATSTFQNPTYGKTQEEEDDG